MKEKKLEDYIQIVQTVETLGELYSANIELELLKGKLFKKRDDPNRIDDDVDVMADISLATKLQDICAERQKDIKEQLKNLGSKEAQIAYNFLRNSPWYINKQLFDEMYSDAQLPRHEWRKKMDRLGRTEKVK